jgi:hypothetical protein
MEHSELIENAFVNYLTGLGPPSPWSAGLLILPGENNLDKDGARIVAYVPRDGGMGEEDPPTSGNRWADPVIELRTPFFQRTPAQIKAGVPDPLAAHQANAAALQSAILSNQLPDLLTAAIEGFTCWGVAERQPMREQESHFWASGWRVRLLSCPASFPA